jgi:hypothetical protein
VYEEKVAQDLGARVFSDIFPALAQALARGDLQARMHDHGVGKAARKRYNRGYLEEVREAALILLYRLLFLFYAEDRGLLPVRDERYHAYSVRRLRERVRGDIDAGRPLATKLDNLYRDLQGVFSIIDEGEDAVGIPAYNGGLFDRARAPILVRSRVPDSVMAPIIDALSRRTEDLLRGWINYRDLSVAHLAAFMSGCSNTRWNTKSRPRTRSRTPPRSTASSPGRPALRARYPAATTPTTIWCA